MSADHGVKRVDVYGFDFGDIMDIWNNCADNTLSVQKTIKVYHKEDIGL